MKPQSRDSARSLKMSDFFGVEMFCSRAMGGRMRVLPFRVLVVMIVATCLAYGQKSVRNNEVTKATLENGLRVVIVQDPLAPVVTVEQNYLVGGDDTPSGFPGMAH